MTKDAAKQPADTKKTPAATTKGAATPQADDDDVEGHRMVRGGGKIRNSGPTGRKG